MKYKKEIAPQWYDFGIQLLPQEHNYQLNVINVNHPYDAITCCHETFEFWLSVDVNASWVKVINALEKIHQNTIAAKIRQDILQGNCIFMYVN